MKAFIKYVLRSMPRVEGFIRRFVLSRFAFPEDEMKLLYRSNVEFAISVDVGAALGHYTWILSSKSRHVFALEPGAHHGNFLSKNIYFSNISLVRAAAGPAVGTAQLFSVGEGEEANHTATLSVSNPVAIASHAKSSTVEMVSLDQVLGEVTGSIDFIKIDVEGFENDVLAGAKSVIFRHHPAILCEIELRHNRNAGDFFSMMREFGYECAYWSDNGFNSFDIDNLPGLQSEANLKRRLSSDTRGTFGNKYINNFFFFHPESKLQARDLIK